MTEQQHPMVPPNILLNNWESDWFAERENADVLLIQAYQAGADAELEATLAEVSLLAYRALADRIRAARRPKPPTLTSIALQMLDTIERDAHYLPEITDTIRRALEALPE